MNLQESGIVPTNVEKRWAFRLIVSSLICVFLLVASFNMGLVSSLHSINAAISSLLPTSLPLNSTDPNIYVEEAKLSSPPPPPPAAPSLPRFAYLISGSKGDLDRLWRTLRALYHPRNQYIVHLDLESSAAERLQLVQRLENDFMYSKVGNVHMNEKANMVTYRGPTMVANTLHACAILLKRSKDWDWFINLSASDYPLVTQDGEFLFSSHFCLV